MKGRLTINNSVCGRWLLSLFTMLLVSVGMQAEDYGLTVGGVPVTSDNAANITGTNITAGTVSFSNGTLTLNGATINGTISSSIADLKVKLVGVSVFNVAMDANSCTYVFNYTGSGNDAAPSLTFSADNLGATLLAYGDQENNKLELVSGYTVSYNPDVSSWINTYRRDTGTDDKPFIRLSKPYPITIAGENIDDSNKDNVMGDDLSEEGSAARVSFNATTNTLTLNNAWITVESESAIVSGLENLTIFLVGENCIYGGSPTFDKTSEVEEATITFTTDRESNGSLFINNMEDYLFGEDVTPEYSNVSIKHEGGSPSDSHTIDGRLGISVGDVDITMSNADDVLGDGTVSYDVESNTLTLNGATIGNGGSDLEPMEACGIEYTGAADLTISLKGTNTVNGTGGCEAIRYSGEGQEIHPKLIFTKGDNKTCSLMLNADAEFEGTVISGGFSEIQGIWGVGATDNGLAIIADNEVQYDSEEGLTIKKVVNYISNYVPLSSTQIASYYGLTISGVPVYEGNKGKITGEGIYGNGSASFEPSTNTLTLNNVNLNPDYAQNDGDLRISIVTSLAQLNINLIGESQTYGIKATSETCKLTFKSAEANRGAARLNFWYDAEPYFVGFGENVVTYNDGLCLREDSYNSSFPMIVALNVPKVITNEKERGLYYPDHEFTFSLEEEVEGFDIYYANMLGGDPVKTTNGKFTLAEGNYVIRAYPIYPGMDTEPSKNWQYASEIYAKVIAKPTFSKKAGTYNEGFTLTLQNVPEQDTREEWVSDEPENILVPQVWCYINDNKNDSIRYDATKGISVTESCKVSVYIIDVDSARKLKSQPVEAQYVIRQDAGLAYTQNNEPVEVAEYTIGGTDNVDLPELVNENGVTVTYTSNDEQVATVNAQGKVTIVGIGETTIMATSAQTATLQAGEASYTLRVYKDLNYESITVTVADATYTGEAVEPTVTVMDGETDITELMIINYDNNVEVGNNATVTIVPNNDLEVNFYVGSRTKTFSIVNRTLEIGTDVNFASGQKWASFYTTTEDLLLPEGVMAYIVTAVGNDAATVKAINYVPKNVPVLIEKESTTTTDNMSAEGNLLRGTTESTAVSGIEGNVYVLYNGGFTRTTSGAIPARRAYLVLEQAAGARLSIVEGEATDIASVGYYSVATDGSTYDMQGRKVESLSKKGLYIKNGRKVVIK